MPRALTTLGERKRQKPVAPGYFVGAELDVGLIRTGVFDASGRILGKSKRSTKLDRGNAVVMKRIAHCITDAIDECDLKPSEISGVGLGVTNSVIQQWNWVVTTTAQVLLKQSFQKELTATLGFPVFVEPDYQLATFGIFEAELDEPPKMLLALFCSTELSAGMMINGSFPPDNTLAPLTAVIQAVQQQMVAKLVDPAITSLNKNKLRKAARSRDAKVLKYAQKVSRFAGLAVAKILNLYTPDVCVIGGGLVDELKDEMMPVILESAKKEVLSKADLTPVFHASDLGDNAVLVGGALLARRNLIT